MHFSFTTNDALPGNRERRKRYSNRLLPAAGIVQYSWLFWRAPDRLLIGFHKATLERMYSVRKYNLSTVVNEVVLTQVNEAAD